MSGCLEVIDGGLDNAIQDAGRYGYRHMGVAVSGFLDPLFAACANALVGNGNAAAAIEIRGCGLGLAVRHGPLRVALTGPLSASVLRHGGSRQELDAWQSATLETGDVLRCGAVNGGTAYLAVSGGIDVAPQLGSRATHRRTGIGGIAGRLLATGDALPCPRLAGNACREYRAEPWRHLDGPIRVIPGPQADHFTNGEFERLLASPYRVTRDSDRMGMRLDGPALVHRSPTHVDIVSDAVAPGALQVPGNGQPILLLADCQTVGGYPKIATVIRADLPRLGQCRTGDELRFAKIDLPQALAIQRRESERLARWQNAIASCLPASYLDEAALYTCNLIDGMVRAEPPTHD